MKTFVILASVAALTFISLSERNQPKDSVRPAEVNLPASSIDTEAEKSDISIGHNCGLPEDSGSGSVQFMKFANKNFYIL